jgi:hypothetical protein
MTGVASCTSTSPRIRPAVGSSSSCAKHFPTNPLRFLLFDHDQKYGLDVPAAIRALQITGVQTSIQSPWQNGVAERWVGSCRRDRLDHIIALNERHLKRLLADYIRYYHDDRASVDAKVALS